MDLTNKYSTAYIAVFTYAMWYAVKETNKLLVEESSSYYDVDVKGFDPSNPPFESWGDNVRGFFPILSFVKGMQAISFAFVLLGMMAHLKINWKVLQVLVVGKFVLDVWSIWELKQAVASWPSVNQATLEILSTAAQPRFWFTIGGGGAMFAVLFSFEFVNLCKQAYANALVLLKKDTPETQEKKDQ